MQHFHSIIFQDLKQLNWNSITTTSFVCSDAFSGPLDLTFQDVWLQVSDHTIVIIWLVKIFFVQLFCVFLPPLYLPNYNMPKTLLKMLLNKPACLPGFLWVPPQCPSSWSRCLSCVLSLRPSSPAPRSLDRPELPPAHQGLSLKGDAQTKRHSHRSGTIMQGPPGCCGGQEIYKRNEKKWCPVL